MKLAIFRVVLIALFAVVLAKAKMLYEALEDNPQISKFTEMVKRDEVIWKIVQFWPVTVFAPTNEAVEKGLHRLVGREDTIASYHVLNAIVPKNLFPIPSTPTLAGSPPLYLSRTMSESDREYYVNNAKILSTENYETSVGKQQILYIIDDILDIYASTSSLPPYALEFLEKPSIYNIDDPLSAFASRVESEGLENLFRREGNHTYFIPVGATSGQSLNRLHEVDEGVIRGHMIPENVLFTRTVGPDAYKSEAYTDELKVELSVINETHAFGNGFLLFAQSNTIHSVGNRHKRGVVRSKILQPNIPVKNGVVHLIENPLMIIDTTVWNFLQNEKEGRLSEFLSLINYAPEFIAQLRSTETKTLFAPTNEAIRDLPIEKLDLLRSNTSALTSLLQLHLAMKSISTDEVWLGRNSEIMSADHRHHLYFRVVGDDRNRTLSVEAAGVLATAIQADIAAVDGTVHIIDRLLGMPYMNMFQKLKMDPDLQITYELGEQDNWGRLLTDTDKRFTFFVPSESAWRELEYEMPTEYKQLRTGAFTYHVHKILDRHLVVGQELRWDDLDRLDEIDMIHGKFKIIHDRDFNDKSVEWEGTRARIIRQDVQAINGIIHVIDRVMMKQKDLTKDSASRCSSPILATLLCVLGFLAML